MKVYPCKNVCLGCIVFPLLGAFIIMISSSCTGEFADSNINYRNVLGNFPDFTPDPDGRL